MAYQMLEFPQTNELIEATMKIEALNQKSELNGNQLDQNFCQDNNDIPKKKIRKSKTVYSPTKIKARNYLSNVAYRRVSDKDFIHTGFIIDMLTYIVMDLKPFFLSTTYAEQENREMIKILWEKCFPRRFHEHVKSPENFTILNSGKVSFKQAKGIVHSYVQMPDIWQEMLKYVRDYHSNYQYVYSLLFPKNYLQSSKNGIKSGNNFALCFEEWQKEKMSREIGKNPFNFTVLDVSRHPFEQMPIKDDFQIEKVLLHPAENKNIKIENDDKFRADMTDSSNKENITPVPALNKRFKYVPTMIGDQKKFDQRFEKPKLPSADKIEHRKKKAEHLTVRLNEIEENIKQVNKN